MITVFLCEDSLDGILTGVYDAWDSRLGHEYVKLQLQIGGNLELFCEYRTVCTDLQKAEKVLRTVRKRMGRNAEEAVCYAAACTDDRKADAIYRLIVLGLTMPDGKKAVHCLQNTSVLLVDKLRCKSWREAEKMLGFLRFEELENGVLYACMKPLCAVLPLVAPHFAERFMQENWIIHDIGRRQAAVHQTGGGWYLTDSYLLEKVNQKGRSGSEEEFQDLWKIFCRYISIEERKNPGCQQNLLPLRFRPYMTEFMD